MKYFFLLFAIVFLTCEKSRAADPVAQSVFQQINHFRAQKKLPRLIWNNEMASLAEKHSYAMSEENDLSHDGASDRFESLKKIIPHLKTYGENIAYNYPQSGLERDTVSRWLKSEDHRENIVGDFTHTGVGIAKSREGKIYFTQIFGQISESTPEKPKKNIHDRGIIFNPPLKGLSPNRRRRRCESIFDFLQGATKESIETKYSTEEQHSRKQKELQPYRQKGFSIASVVARRSDIWFQYLTSSTQKKVPVAPIYANSFLRHLRLFGNRPLKPR